MPESRERLSPGDFSSPADLFRAFHSPGPGGHRRANSASAQRRYLRFVSFVSAAATRRCGRLRADYAWGQEWGRAAPPAGRPGRRVMTRIRRATTTGATLAGVAPAAGLPRRAPMAVGFAVPPGRAAEEASDAGERHEAALGSKATILVVDDEPDVREVLEEYLATHGYETMGAGSADAARALVAKHAIDLALVDITMPGEDG